MNSTKATLFLCFFVNATLCAEQEQKPAACQKKWTFMVYMEAANDLGIFAPRNIRQMQQVGSNENINIVVQHNTYEKNQYLSQTFLIEKTNRQLIKERSSLVDTGEENLVNFCCDTIAAYPADHYALILWNHGTGPIEPLIRTSLSSTDIFSINNSSEFFEKENHGFTPLQTGSKKHAQQKYKGICFNDESGKFLTEKHLCRALKTICATSLNNGKIDLIGFDACLMAMIEIAAAVEPYAKIMVASQDVERGTGWNYHYVLYPFALASLTPEEFGEHIVNAFQRAYQRIADFTLSCIVLEKMQRLIETTSHIASLLHKLLTVTEEKKVKLSVKISRNRHLCTYFDEPDFIDLNHFYDNLLLNIGHLTDVQETSLELLNELKERLSEGKDLIEQSVHANTTGSAYPHAKGISIYFPEHAIHSSYRRCCFAMQTTWLPFLKSYLSAYKK